MIFKFFRCFRDLKMKYQVILFGCLIMAIVLLIILGTCLVQASILFTAIQSSSKVITTKQEKRSIQQTAARIQGYLERKYDQAINNILHIEKFFETIQYIQELCLSSELFPSCQKQTSTNKKKQNIKYDTDHFCYQSLQNSDGFTLPQNEKIHYFNKSVSMLSEYTLLFDVSNTTQLYIFDLPTPQMIISYPQSYQVKNYNISNRPWYISYQNQSANNPKTAFYYSPVFFSAIANDLVLAVLSTIEIDTPIGFAAQTFTLKDQNIQSIPINVILADDSGKIILTSIDSIIDATDQISIYNTTYTGFNESDWEKIKAHSNDVDQPSNYCDGFSDTFCLYNKYFNRNVQVDALKFLPEKFTLVVFVNITFSTSLDQQYIQLTNSLSKQILQIEWILIIVCFFLLGISAAMIQILFLPLFKLMKEIKLHIRTLGNNLDKQIFTMTTKLSRYSNIFSKLSNKFMTLQDILGNSQSQKSDLCQQIEKFLYNKKNIPYDLTNLKSKIKDMNDSQASQKPIDRQYNLFYDVFNSPLNELYLINQ